MTIAPCTPDDIEPWLALRTALWDYPEAAERDDVQRLLAEPARYGNFIAREGDEAIGFAEASVRADYVNGCDTSPVAFLEGIYVAPGYRLRGVARALIDACAAWGREHGVMEFASDAYVDDNDSHAMHKALGFEETERVVYFRRTL